MENINTILISPYSKKLISGQRNPKNYPYWNELVKSLNKYDVIQIGVKGEEKIKGVKTFKQDLPLVSIKKLIEDCVIWISSDNFLPHLAHHIRKPGVVIFGVSDPDIFGYPENLNILKDRKYLRENQFLMYDDCIYNSKVFLKADIISNEIKKLIPVVIKNK